MAGSAAVVTGSATWYYYQFGQTVYAMTPQEEGYGYGPQLQALG